MLVRCAPLTRTSIFRLFGLSSLFASSLALAGPLACSSTSGALQDSGVDAGPDTVVDAPIESGPVVGKPVSKIEHVVVIVQENHTFDNHFGAYCTAAPGSNPTCTTGPACCEAAPKTDARGHAVGVLDDAANAAFSPDHTHDCEVREIDGGKMDHFFDDKSCGDARNVAVAGAAMMQPYWDYAHAGAIADHYFQSSAGQSSQNDMFLAVAKYVFRDNSVAPKSTLGDCQGESTQQGYPDSTVYDVLGAAGVGLSWYGEGLKTALDAIAAGGCPSAPVGCGASIAHYPCTFDPGDVPFAYYSKFLADPQAMRDYAKLADDLAAGTLPAVSFVKAIGYRSEHPGVEIKLSDGIGFVQGVVAAVAASSANASTLVLVTYDEGGGYWDHVAPPPDNAIDHEPYGTRTPFIAIGPFSRSNFVSHTMLEHASIVKFIEWNWLGAKTGQLGARDTIAHNLGSLLDPAKTGVAVPED